jgi:MFS transporter, TsgA protein
VKTERKNIVLIMILAYLLTFVAGGVTMIPFAIKFTATSSLHSTSEYIGYVFSFFMIGYLLANFLNGYIIKFIKLKYEIFLLSFIYIVFVLLMLLVTSATSLLAPILVIGFVMGIIYTIPNFLIVRTFKDRKRISQMNRLDCCYGIGALAYPLVAGYMLKFGYSWQEVFISVIIIFIIIIILSFFIKFPDLNISNEDGDSENKALKVNFSKWNFDIYLVGLLMFFYVLSYMGFTYWIVDYVTVNFHLNILIATFGLSLFWIFYAIGVFISSFIVKNISISKYMLFSGIIAILAYVLILNSHNYFMFYISISLLGYGCSTIFSSTISYGTLMLKKPSPVLVGFFIAISSIGIIATEQFSSYLQSEVGLKAVIWTSVGYMIIAMVILCVIMKRRRSIIEQ